MGKEGHTTKATGVVTIKGDSEDYLLRSMVVCQEEVAVCWCQTVGVSVNHSVTKSQAIGISWLAQIDFGIQVQLRQQDPCGGAVDTAIFVASWLRQLTLYGQEL